MQVYAAMDQRMTLGEVAAHARRAEALGYDGLNVPDAVHDGLLIAYEALRATERLKVAISVLVAFPRSPMIVAVAAWDLQSVSGGRFELGLGTQVRGNIVGRYSTPWTAPVPRMREYVQSLRAIFASFQEGVPLKFEGEHYQFTKMQPFFNPGPIDHPNIPIYLGAVGPVMTALAGEVADGHMSHPTHSAPRVLEELALPALERGAKRAGRNATSLERMAAGMVSTGIDEVAVEAERKKNRELLGFLYSTPSYWPALEIHGRREVGEQLHSMTREGRWAEMPGAIDDDLLETMIPSGTYDEIADRLRERNRGLATQITFPMPDDPANDPRVAEVIAALRA
ncbi:MAG: TIGR03617 family F420-dependent LLM class oxidoreductase [Myxococcota bacterium]|jgi:probable F420-dependent oxidoreductase|nr:TIGR03617 family F420-dependent LLM class oxidoreductase [Myxococcota bacterium]